MRGNFFNFNFQKYFGKKKIKNKYKKVFEFGVLKKYFGKFLIFSFSRFLREVSSKTIAIAITIIYFVIKLGKNDNKIIQTKPNQKPNTKYQKMCINFYRFI